MKKIILGLLATLSISLLINAQAPQKPRESQKAQITQTVGFTNITVDYSRPNKKGRVIFGELVPYDKIWRTGANENTTIEFTNDVEIGGKTLPKGKYAIYSLPQADKWEVIFYADSNNWGNPKEWDDSKIALKVTAPVQKIAEEIETFTIGINNLTTSSAHLQFIWDTTLVDVEVACRE